MKNKQALKTQEVEKSFLQVRVAPETLNEEMRTVDVVFTSGARGLRHGFFQDYYEELAVDPESMRTRRLIETGVALINHKQDDVMSIVGIVESVSIDAATGAATARIRFDDDEMSEPVFRKIKRGFIRSVSVGYFVHKYEELEERENELPVFRAVDWEPAEISFVTIPFDQFAKVRSQEGQSTKCVLLEKEGESMKKKNNLKKREEEKKEDEVKVEAQESQSDEGGEAKDEPAEVESESKEPHEVEGDKSEDAAEPKEDASEVTTQSAASLLRIVSKAKLGVEFAQTLLERVHNKELSMAEAHAAVIDEWSKSDNKKVRGSMKVEAGSYDRLDVVTKGIENAMLNRFNSQKFPLEPFGEQFRASSLVDMSRDLLEAYGFKTRQMYKQEIAKMVLSMDTRIKIRTGFHGTSDFPEIVANVMNKSLREAYDRFPQTFRPWTSRNTASDFKQISRVQLGEGPTLRKVTEHGEFTYGTFGEMAEKYALATYGVICPITRQLIINDDLNAFMRVPVALGLNAADLESDIVYEILTSNPNMADSNALFSSQHANLGTAGAIAELTLSEARKLGRTQTGIDGKPLNINLRYLIVPAALETSAQKQVSAVVPNQTSGVNVFNGLYQVIAEPRLDAVSETNWYMAAEPGRVDTIEYSYLEGNESVFIEQEVEFDTDGLKIKARHDFAAKAIDWRGLFKNPFAG